MRVFFAGTPDIAVPSLIEINTKFEVCGVLTNPDKFQGRKRKLIPSPVKAKALELKLKIFQPSKLDDEFIQNIKELKPDILVCIAFGRIFREKFLSIFPLGGINLHPSLLPKYRGPSPLSAVILGGDRVTGISIQRLAKKMDSGNILYQEEFKLNGDETTGSLTDKVAIRGASLIVPVIADIENGVASEYEQDDTKCTFCKLTNKSDGLINWNNKSEAILNSIRAYNPWPMAFTYFKDKSLNIIEAVLGDNTTKGQNGEVLGYSKTQGFEIQTGDGTIYIKKLQLQSKKALDYKSFNNGIQNFVGTKLG